MRITLTRSASIALALALTAMLTPGEVSEAKGGRAVSWQAAVPTTLEGRNLAGFSGPAADEYAVFQDEGFRGSIRVVVSSSKVGGSYFNLMFLPGTAEEGYGVRIAGVTLVDPAVTAGELPCQFGEECGTGPPDCLECALNRAHPYSAYSPGYGFGLQVGTVENIESQPVGEPGDALGRLFLFLDDYSDKLGQYHSVICSSPPKTVTIRRSGPDEWKIFNEGPQAVLTCEEYYRKPLVGRGPRYVDQTVMTAKAVDAFVFQMIWTRK